MSQSSHPISALCTDWYQIMMFDSYVRSGLWNRKACFELFFRSAPDGAPFAIACGLDVALDFVAQFRFQPEELAYLTDVHHLSHETISVLRDLAFSGEIWAVPEGTPMLANTPLLRVIGSIGLLQLLESPLLNIINYHTLVASKASRIVRVAAPRPITEFGLRRAHGPSAALYAARAAYIAGAAATSNVEAGWRLGIPVQGTMSHAYVMGFPDETTAFRNFVATRPEDAVLLVDTYDTLQSGVPHAITVAKELAQRGYRLKAIRLDSGDLASLSIMSRKMLDDAGLQDVAILASNDLDEFQIQELAIRGAAIDAYGVGTRLVTAFSEPALGGIFKLVAVEGHNAWEYKHKTTSDPNKMTLPGPKQVIRCMDVQGKVQMDILALADEDEKSLGIPSDRKSMPLLTQVWKGEKRLRAPLPLSDIRQYCAAQIASLPDEVKVLSHPRPIPLALGPKLQRASLTR